MLLPIPVLNDYNLIWEWRQTLIDHMAAQENWHYQFKDYEVGDEVLVKVYNPAGLKQRAVGPFVVEQIHTNGTLTIQGMPNVYERINIRRLRPYTPA